jgi:precorrin-6A/cobalt-precorrin-6A reductase
MRTVLVLGGTNEGRALAAKLVGLGSGGEAEPGGILGTAGGPVPGEVRVISSLAGRVSDLRMPVGEVRVGGFGGVEGLVAFLRAEGVSAVVDATHPFASRITANAVEAARRVRVPYLLLRRPGWVEQPGDRWQWVDSLAEAARVVEGRRAFITTGRQGLGVFRDGVARTVDPPEVVASGVSVLLDRGPYTVEGELLLLREHGIEVLVTKDSGGEMTSAKLVAARRLGLPVVVVRRPPVPEGVPSVASVAAAVDWVSRGSGAG